MFLAGFIVGNAITQVAVILLAVAVMCVRCTIEKNPKTLIF